jgi:hypothetical protein
MNIFWIVVAMPGTPSVQQSVLYVNCVRENGQELKVIFDKWYYFAIASRAISAQAYEKHMMAQNLFLINQQKSSPNACRLCLPLPLKPHAYLSFLA